MESGEEFTNIAGPVISLQEIEKIGRKPLHPKLGFSTRPGHVVEGELPDVLRTFPQWGELHGAGSNAKQEVVAERTGGNHPVKISIGRGNQPEIACFLRPAADRAKTMFLEDSQEGFLERLWQFSNLVEEKGSTVGLFDNSAGLLSAPVKAPFSCPKGAFHDSLGQGGTVHDNKRLIAARTVHMEGPGKQLLSRSRLPGDKYAHVTSGSWAR